MKYIYKFCTGTEQIEVSEYWFDILTQMDKEEERNNRSETRRHEPLQYDGEWFAREELDPAYNLESQERVQEFLQILNEDQTDLFQKIFIEGHQVSEYAKSCGVSQPAISSRIKTIKRKIKEIIEEPYNTPSAVA